MYERPTLVTEGIIRLKRNLTKKPPLRLPTQYLESHPFIRSGLANDAFLELPQHSFHDNELNGPPAPQDIERSIAPPDGVKNADKPFIKGLVEKTEWKPIPFIRKDYKSPTSFGYGIEETLAATEQTEEFKHVFRSLESEIGKYMVGHEHLIRSVLIAIFAEGHVIIEGFPGTGKTQLINTIADAIDLTFRRISFAPDLVPQDITGSEILIENKDTGERIFKFREGPVFTNLLLADEINRGHPRVHSALLEAMQERKVTFSNVEHPLPRPFFVLATMNPLEQDATYALPEAQQDRFLFKLLANYTNPAEDMEILNRTTGAQIPIVKNVCDGETVMRLSRLAREVPIAKPVQAYAIRLVHATRPNGDYLPVSDIAKACIRVGASPRAEQAMVIAGKVRALAEGRLNVSFEDIDKVASDVLRHRLIFTFDAQELHPDSIIHAIMNSVNPYDNYDPAIFELNKKE